MDTTGMQSSPHTKLAIAIPDIFGGFPSVREFGFATFGLGGEGVGA